MENPLPDAAIEVSRRLREVISHLTRRLNELRAVQYALKESGDDERAGRIELVADSLELAISQLARLRIRLDVASTGSAEVTPAPGRITGEWKPVPPKRKKDDSDSS
jgi:hypothetical protein